ncbi:hypothetical protein ABW20_dc0103791 [Dactylellina cionopaga]|nr:hypothetical protein ABW20_dc0103791 [Dactylellina cionopaga]
MRPFYGTAWAAPPPAYNTHNIPTNSTGPQYGGHTYASNYNAAGSPPAYSGANADYYGQQPQQPPMGPPPQGYEMNNYGGSGSGPYIPPRPEQAHVSKH